MAKAKKLPSGSWRVLVFAGYKNGRRVYKSFTAASKKQAEMDAALYLHQQEPEDDITIGQAVDRYIEAKNTVLSPKTIREYKGIRRNAFPDVMTLKLQALTSEKMQLAVNQYAAGRSPKTVKNALGLVTASLDLFAPDKRIRVTLPRAKKTPLSIPTNAQLKALVDAAQEPLKTAMLFAAALGLRRSEICALQWQDVNLKQGTIAISKAIVLDDMNLWTVKDPKTETSNRVVDLPPLIVDHLKTIPRTDDRIVPFTPDSITYRFITLRNKLGLTIRFHDLRHYYASLLLALGVPDLYAMERMGHATTHMLKSVYQHTMKDKQEEITSSINTALEERFS